MARVNRDPFARVELHREVARTYKDPARCIWCGRITRLFEYRIEHDDGRRDYIKGLFCGVGCYRSYHEVPTR